MSDLAFSSTSISRNISLEFGTNDGLDGDRLAFLVQYCDQMKQESCHDDSNSVPDSVLEEWLNFTQQ